MDGKYICVHCTGGRLMGMKGEHKGSQRGEGYYEIFEMK